MMPRLTKRYRFSASHRLHAGRLSAEQNLRVFGKCNNPHGHGHNYTLEVSVSGPIDPDSGMVISRSQLDDVVERHVLSQVDHADLNRDVEELRDTVPTTENLALLIAGRLGRAGRREFGAAGPRVERIRVEETARNSFEVTV